MKIFEKFKNIFNKKNKLLPIVLIIILVVLVAGVAYATTAKSLIFNNSNSLTSGVVSMSYTESSNVVTLDNAFTITDSEGKVQNNYFDFTVTSNLTINNDDESYADVNYDIILEKLTIDSGYLALTDSQIKVYLEDITNDTTPIVEPVLISELSDSDSNKLLLSTKHTHKYGLNTIATKYRLRAWIDYNNSNPFDWEDEQYEYKFRINVNGDVNSVKRKFTLYELMENQVDLNAKITYQYINDAKKTINNVLYNDGDNGLFLYNGTDDNGGSYPIYYYRGNVTNNNVLFGGFCWKIIRTTSTGGIKMIYNGIPTDGKCNNTGTASQLSSTSAFNSDSYSPADVGYMYGTRYNYSAKLMIPVFGNKISSYILSSESMSSTTYYYYDDASYTNPVPITWSSNYASAVGKWTCFSTTTSTCTKPYYIAGSTSSYAYYNSKSSIVMADDVTYSGSTYTLNSPTTVDLKDYYTNYSNYKSKYSCSDLTSTSCSLVDYSTSTSSTYITTVIFTNGETVYTNQNQDIVYGNNVTYSNGIYTLNNTTTSKPTNWSTDRKTLANSKHYTCFTTSTTCSTVYYITYFGESSHVYYLALCQIVGVTQNNDKEI